MKNPALRAAVKRETEEADRKLQVIQAGVGGPIPRLVVQTANNQADLEPYVGKSVWSDLQKKRAKTPSTSCSTCRLPVI